MRAISYSSFDALPEIIEVPDPVCPVEGAVVRVAATGVCRSDWHAWKGHDDSVVLPQIPGHEFAGTVSEVGSAVTRVAVGDRVTAAFVFACGECEQCREGATQVCLRQEQPGFTLDGSYAEALVVPNADLNLVRLPDAVGFIEAAGLGCRFGTAYHALHVRGRVAPGEWVAVFGCGGVGLSAVIVALAAGARVVASDVSVAALEAARALGAVVVAGGSGAVDAVRAATGGGAHLAIDAVGSRVTAEASIAVLRPRGRHVQVGLLLGPEAAPAIPLGRVIALELELLGSHGIARGGYTALLDDIVAGRLRPADSVGRTIAFEDLPAALAAMDASATTPGMTVAVLTP
ncbi:alcohol dehydrogenase [Rathayibacter rathayi]|uniref:alcohol dehydrogenase catalytic domain-containing protein n=3 Tax=Rathayibacter rathayi TaxID=33887 RepID=UPI000BE409A4|nr:alcohol dehydrogenase catalytic domain-containing protein [Rathayibacter rathayi]AZZ50479.1 alcohol dehydrogenase [Rathayibacter rathayi]MWV73369.1 alcohol dehydrogenase catalytic domain-containing protein [Rathayibacter rathayi NCPPB 2980 = VKM Ac-1601]PPF22297.1 alcohol dehydrogenase [Rathayibacter rathayi]PPF52067.1 alcohol dehydrogenase [Rathayibacter rathayi]PPG72241.1 alcohol dehydrogenase [Rathayibacter rathayi]